MILSKLHNLDVVVASADTSSSRWNSYDGLKKSLYLESRELNFCVSGLSASLLPFFRRCLRYWSQKKEVLSFRGILCLKGNNGSVYEQTQLCHLLPTWKQTVTSKAIFAVTIMDDSTLIEIRKQQPVFLRH